MNIKKGDMVSIKQDFIDRNNRYEYDSRDIWEVKEVWFSDNGLGARGCRLCINIPEYTAFKDGDVLWNEEVKVI